MLLVNAVGFAQSPQQIAESLSASTVILELKDMNGRPSHGSGFFISPGLVATNAHVIDGRVSGVVRIVQQPHPFMIDGIVAIDRSVDLAVVKVATVAVPALSLGNSDNVRRGDVIYTLGNPRSLEGVFSEGRISNIIPDGIAGLSGKVLQFTAAISRGSSGGAVVNNLGEVVGIVSQTRDDGQNLNFAVPVNALKRLMETASGPVRPLSSVEMPTSEVEGTSEINLLGLVVLCGVAFVVLHLLPIVKSEKLWLTISVASGLAVSVAILQSVIPNLFSEPMRYLYNAEMSEQGLSHMLGCRDCVPKLVMLYAKAISYFALMWLLVGLSNKIKGFEITGFFHTVGVASLIVVVEWIVRAILPFG